MLRLLHVSDLHFGRKNIPEQIDAIRALIARETFDVIAISGDLTQRTRAYEFAQARAFLDEAASRAPTIAVPGNHDVRYWNSLLHAFGTETMIAAWRRGTGRAPDPVLQLPGVTIVGINTAHGIAIETQTTRLRDLSVIGYLSDQQLRAASHTFAAAPPENRRVVLMHHNLVAGQLSRRLGFPRRRVPGIIDAFARMKVDLVLCGHDHQEAVNFVGHPEHGFVVCTASTISTMARGHRPTAFNVIGIDATRIFARSLVWDTARRDFVAGAEKRFEPE